MDSRITAWIFGSGIEAGEREMPPLSIPLPDIFLFYPE